MGPNKLCHRAGCLHFRTSAASAAFPGFLPEIPGGTSRVFCFSITVGVHSMSSARPHFFAQPALRARRPDGKVPPPRDTFTAFVVKPCAIGYNRIRFSKFCQNPPQGCLCAFVPASGGLLCCKICSTIGMIWNFSVPAGRSTPPGTSTWPGIPCPGRARPTRQYGTVTTSISARPRPAAWYPS